MEVTAVVLAGGDSSRMGRDKAFIEFAGKSLIQRTLDTLKPIFKEIFIIAKERDPFLSFAVPVYADIDPGSGPMGGVYTGLFQSKGPVFAVACDMPFLNPEVIRVMASQLQDFDAVVPRTSDGLHPLHAVYSRSVLPLVEDLLNQGDVKMMNFLKKIRMLEIDLDPLRRLDPNLRFLTNINTPDEYKNALIKDSR